MFQAVLNPEATIEEEEVLPTQCNLSKSGPLALLGVRVKNAVYRGYQALLRVSNIKLYCWL